VGESIYAAKEVVEEIAMQEYRLLQDLNRLGTPAVEPLAVVSGRRAADGTPLESVLLTRHLQFSLPYRSLFSVGVRQDTVSRLIDAMVVLLARLHLIGFMWRDVSLSNILFRRDAGEFAAYLVDAETGELHTSLTDGQREHDLTIAGTNLFGDFCDLQAGDMLDPSLDPLQLVEAITSRYDELWSELTGVEEFPERELDRIEGRVRRLNALGFDVAELDISTEGKTIRIQPKVVDAGHHMRRLMRLTGLDTEENQARRLLNDLDTFRARGDFAQVDESIAAHKWLAESFEPVVAAIPRELMGKRDPAQIYHEVLDYRWYQSQREHREVPLTEAVQGYIEDVLKSLPDEQMSQDDLRIVTPDEQRHLVNEFDPSMGFEDSADTPFDPWEDANSSEIPDVLDLDTLRRLAGGRRSPGGESPGHR
jgi:hypothetical protein